MNITKCHDTQYGRLEVSPTGPIPAGVNQRFAFKYTAGPTEISEGGKIHILERHSSDWGTPQMDRPEAPNYMWVSAPEGRECELEYFYSWIHGPYYPWRRVTEIKLSKGSLKEGESATLHWGGALGFEISRYSVNYPFLVVVDPEGKDKERFVFAEKLTVRISGYTPARLRISIPSEIREETKITTSLKVEDEYGNPVDRFSGKVKLTGADGSQAHGLDREIQFLAEDKGLKKIELNVNNKGEYFTIRGQIDGGDYFRSNQAKLIDEPTDYNLIWGDVHAHCLDGIGMGTLQECYDYARDAACLDYIAIAANDAFITDDCWGRYKKLADENQIDGEFVTFLAYEWHGVSAKGGDHVVVFRNTDEPIHRSSRFSVGINDDLIKGDPNRNEEYTDAETIEELYQLLRDKRVFLVPHVCGFKADLDRHYESIEPIVEIWSHHGDFTDFGEDALRRGYLVGLISNSDDHTGHTGDSYPYYRDRPKIYDLHEDPYPGKRNMQHGGVTGAYIKGPMTRDSILEAYYSRRVYGTSGVRILLNFTLNSSPMGGLVPLTDAGMRKHLEIEAAGTAKITKVEISKNLEILETIEVNELTAKLNYDDTQASNEGDYYIVKVFQEDNNLAWSSPIWLKSS